MGSLNIYLAFFAMIGAAVCYGKLGSPRLYLASNLAEKLSSKNSIRMAVELTAFLLLVGFLSEIVFDPTTATQALAIGMATTVFMLEGSGRSGMGQSEKEADVKRRPNYPFRSRAEPKTFVVRHFTPVVTGTAILMTMVLATREVVATRVLSVVLLALFYALGLVVLAVSIAKIKSPNSLDDDS